MVHGYVKRPGTDWSGTAQSRERGGYRGANSARRHVGLPDHGVFLLDIGRYWIYFVILVMNGYGITMVFLFED